MHSLTITDTTDAEILCLCFTTQSIFQSCQDFSWVEAVLRNEDKVFVHGHNTVPRVRLEQETP